MTPIVTISNVPFDVAHLVLTGLVIVLAGFAIWLNSRRKSEGSHLKRELDHAQDTLFQVRKDLEYRSNELRTQQEVARQSEVKLAEVRARSAEDEQKFAHLASSVLEKANAQFLQLANTHFEKHTEGAKGNLQQLMKPISENLETFAKRVSEIEKVRVQDRSVIQEQVKAIGESLRVNTNETNKLVNALTAPKGGGRWGEMTLRNVLEQAGLSSHCDFNEQVHDAVDGGVQRPDAVIRLPGHREIVVDSKVSLDAYMKANATTDAAERAMHLKAHAASVQRHISTLASKGYQDNLSERVDFVAMFIPGENFFAAALEHSPGLLEAAYAKNVIVTTPSTLIGLAKTVAYVWRQDSMTENAREAAELGAVLYERLVAMGGHIEKLGKSLNSAVENYNKMNGSLERKVLPAARKFDALNIAPTHKSLPQLEKLENNASLPDRNGELNFDDDDTLAAE